MEHLSGSRLLGSRRASGLPNRGCSEDTAWRTRSEFTVYVRRLANGNGEQGRCLVLSAGRGDRHAPGVAGGSSRRVRREPDGRIHTLCVEPVECSGRIVGRWTATYVSARRGVKVERPADPGRATDRRV